MAGEFPLTQVLTHVGRVDEYKSGPLMKNFILVLILSFLTACATPQRILTNNARLKAMYKPYQEIAFCLSLDGRVYNILHGGLASVPMPYCQKNDIPVHSHSVLSEDFANILDIQTWKDYRKKFGHIRFGLMTKDEIKIYYIGP